MSVKYWSRQMLAPLIGSLGVFCAGSTYVWVNPVSKYLQSERSPFNMTDDQLSWYGAVVEVGDLAATLPSGYMADKVGRKATLLSTGPIIVATWILVQLTSSYTLLIVSRIIQGLAVGCLFTVTPIYLGEIADKKVRGLAGTLVQSMWYLGIVFQFSAGPYLSYIPGINIVCLAPAVAFTLLFWFCPETPRYYLLKKDREKANEMLAWLYGENVERSQLEKMLPAETSDRTNEADGFLDTFVEFFKSWRCTKSLCLVSAIAVTNVIGVTPILSYSTDTFEKITPYDASLITLAMGCLTLVTSWVAAATVDRLGRRPLLLLSTCSSGVVLLIGAVLARGSVLQALCVSLYPSLMSLGPGTLSYTLMAELFSDRHRGLGAALVTLLAAIATFLGLKFYNVIQSTWGLETNLYILSSICLLSTVLIHKFLPETKGKTFEEIQTLL